MTWDDVAEKVIEVISDQFGCDTDEISIDDHLVKDLACDDAELMKIGMCLEEEFDATLPDELDLRTMTVNDLVDAVCEAVGVTP